MKRFIMIFLQILFLATLTAQQSIEEVLTEVEKNNTSLQAIRSQMEARRIGNAIGNYLPNPEFEYAWFAGSPQQIGSKTGVSLMQSMEFPTAYLHRNRIAHARNEQLSTEYDHYLRNLLHKVRLTCLELIYVNRMEREIGKRIERAQTLSDAYSEMLEAGETNIIEANKVKLNLLGMQKEAEQLRIRRSALQNSLTSFNGGNAIAIEADAFPEASLDEDFNEWYQRVESNHPLLRWMQQETNISRQEIKLQRAKNLPNIHMGYVSEMLSHEQFRGFAVGVSIPLFENKNTVKYATARTSALETEWEDQQHQYFHFLKQQHEKASGLKTSTEEYKRLMEPLDNTHALTQALEGGQISLTEYLVELTFIYQTIDQLLEMEFNLHTALAELKKFSGSVESF